MEIRIPHAFYAKLCKVCETVHAPIRGCPHEGEKHMAKCKLHPDCDEPCSICNAEATSKLQTEES